VPQRAIAAALFATGLPKIRLLDLAPTTQFDGWSFQYNASILEEVAVIGDGKRDACILFYQQNGNAKLLPDVRDPHNQIFDDYRGQAERQLVDQK
jgi:hypothetical protein